MTIQAVQDPPLYKTHLPKGVPNINKQQNICGFLTFGTLCLAYHLGTFLLVLPNGKSSTTMSTLPSTKGNLGAPHHAN